MFILLNDPLLLSGNFFFSEYDWKLYGLFILLNDPLPHSSCLRSGKVRHHSVRHEGGMEHPPPLNFCMSPRDLDLCELKV